MRFEQPGPGQNRRSRRRRPFLLGLTAFLGVLILIASVSVCNYYDVSLRLPTPASELSEPAREVQKLSRLPSAGIDWSFAAGDAIAGPPVVHGDMVYFTEGSRSLTGRITALDFVSGRLVWTYPLQSVADSSPTVAGDFLYVGTRGGRVIALERETGREVWSYKTEALLHGSPVVSEGMLFIASDRVHALDALTGEVLWIHRPEGDKAIRPLAHSQGVIAVLSAGNHLNLIDAVKGRRRLTAKLWFGVGSTPMIFGDMVAVTGDSGSIQALYLHARDIPMEKALRFWWTRLWLWKSAPRPPDPVGYSWHNRGVGGLSATITSAGDGRLFLAANHPDHNSTVFAVDAASGEVLWSRRLRTRAAEGTELLEGALADGTLVLGTQVGTIYGLEASSGEISWQLSLDFPVAAISIAMDGTLLVTTETGVLYKLR